LIKIKEFSRDKL